VAPRERLRLAPRTAAWDRHPHAAIRVDPKHVAPGAPMSDEISGFSGFSGFSRFSGFRGFRFEWKAQLHPMRE
jgi:hypothetical protein